ncbi:MAG: deoxyribose-phosphate aldolase [Phycisphaerales bacterium]|nr:deoxyribose-phosphate aldolase [Phycisphaerales bacterium]
MSALPVSPTIDTVAAEQRARSFTTRSIKNESKAAALRLAIAMTDLTTLEGKDSPEKVRSLCRKAVRPFPADESVLGERLPSVAAVCVYPSMAPVAAEMLHGTGVRVASVATGFPSGQYPLDVRIRDVRHAIEAGTDEIDMVINRGAFLSGRYREVCEEIREVVHVCTSAGADAGRAVHLKVILETGELETLDNVRRASDLAIASIRDGDFIKTSTGKVQPAATMPVCLVMLEAIRDEFLRSGRRIGLKPAGGIRTAKQAWHYLCMVHETMGPLDPGRPSPWLDPNLFRFGASSLLNDLLRSFVKLRRGAYPADDEFADA